MQPLSPKLVPQLFLIIQQSGVYPTIKTAWSIDGLLLQRQTPREYFSQPSELTAAVMGPSCSIWMMVSSETPYIEFLDLLDTLSRSLVQHRPQARVYEVVKGVQGYSDSQGSPFSSALSSAVYRYPPLQLLPRVHFSRYCSDKSIVYKALLKAFPCRISELQHMATVAKDQQVPHDP